MRDDYLSADWADHHRQASRAIHKLVHRAWLAMIRLNAIQFDAPWRRQPARR